MDRFSATLDDYHARNADRSPKYRKVRGVSRPVFEPPKGVGHLEKRRGENAWLGFLWVPPTTLNDMLALLLRICCGVSSRARMCPKIGKRCAWQLFR